VGRVPRSALEGDLFHVYARGVCETNLFAGDDDRRLFLQLLERTKRRHGWSCHAYCLLSTHYHLVLEARTSELSRGLCELNGSYARRANRRRDRFGHLFAGRFGARVIASEEYLFEACAYVVLNPVKANLCDRIEDWAWSYSAFGLAAS
jgi:REP element-mobilizing transposase RayT